MRGSKNFVMTVASRTDGVASENWVPAHGAQATIEAVAFGHDWDVRGKISYASGSRRYRNSEYVIYVEYGKGGRINHANKGPANAKFQSVEKIVGKDKLGQIVDLLSGAYKKELVS